MALVAMAAVSLSLRTLKALLWGWLLSGKNIWGGGKGGKMWGGWLVIGGCNDPTRD